MTDRFHLLALEQLLAGALQFLLRVEYLDYVVTRILVLGSAYLAAVCLLPETPKPACRPSLR